MKILYLILIIIPMITTSFNLYAQGMAASMGGLTVVASDGPFDARRNPAILTIQKDYNSFGIAFSSDTYNSAVSHSAGEFDVEIPETPETPMIEFIIRDTVLKNNFSRVSSITGGFAYTRKITENIFAGLAVIEETERSKHTSAFSNTIDIPSFSIYDQIQSTASEERENNSKTTCSLSVGYKVLSFLSIGFQIIGDYSYMLKKSKTREYEGLDHRKNKSSKTCTQSVIPMIGLGAIFKKGMHEAGLMVTSGKYSWQKIEYYDNAQYFNRRDEDPEDWDIRSRKEKKGKYIEGPGIIAGYHSSITSFFGVALEVGIILPLEYTEHNQIVNDSQAIYIDQENTRNMKLAYMVNGGFVVNPVNDFKIAFGAGYRMMLDAETKQKSEYGDAISRGKSKENIKAYFGTIGIENKVLQKSKIVINFTAVQLKFDNKGSSTSISPNMTNDIEMEMDLEGFQLYSAISYIQNF